MNAILTAAAIFSLYAFSTIAVIFCAQKRDRFPSVVVALSFPFILVGAVFFALSGKAETIALRPCPHGLEEAEALVERKRQLMFNGPSREPNIAKVWRKRYAMSVELQARKMRSLSLELKEHLATI